MKSKQILSKWTKQKNTGQQYEKSTNKKRKNNNKKNQGEPKPRRVVSSGLLPTISSFVIEQAKNPVEVTEDLFLCERNFWQRDNYSFEGNLFALWTNEVAELFHSPPIVLSSFFFWKES